MSNSSSSFFIPSDNYHETTKTDNNTDADDDDESYIVVDQNESSNAVVVVSSQQEQPPQPLASSSSSSPSFSKHVSISEDIKNGNTSTMEDYDNSKNRAAPGAVMFDHDDDIRHKDDYDIDDIDPDYHHRSAEIGMEVISNQSITCSSSSHAVQDNDDNNALTVSQPKLIVPDSATAPSSMIKKEEEGPYNMSSSHCIIAEQNKLPLQQGDDALPLQQLGSGKEDTVDRPLPAAAASRDAVSLGSVLDLCSVPSQVDLNNECSSSANWYRDNRQHSSAVGDNDAYDALYQRQDAKQYCDGDNEYLHSLPSHCISAEKNKSRLQQGDDALPLQLHVSVKEDAVYGPLPPAGAIRDEVSLGCSVLELCHAPNHIVLKTECSSSSNKYGDNQQHSSLIGDNDAHDATNALYHQDALNHIGGVPKRLERMASSSPISSAEKSSKSRLHEVNDAPQLPAPVKADVSNMPLPLTTNMESVSLGSVLQLCLAPTEVLNSDTSDYDDETRLSSTNSSIDFQQMSGLIGDDDDEALLSAEERRVGEPRQPENNRNPIVRVMPGALRVRGIAYAVSSEFDDAREQGEEAFVAPLQVIATAIDDKTLRQSIHRTILQGVVVAQDFSPFQRHDADCDLEDDTSNTELIQLGGKGSSIARWYWLASTSLIIAVVVIAVTIGVTTMRRQEQQLQANINTPTAVPPITTRAPTLTSRFEAFRALLLNNSVSSGTTLFNASSPQYKAIHWLAEEDEAALLPNSSNFDVIKERFILSTLYFCTNGANWTSTLLFLSNEDICQWSGVVCNSANQVNELRLSKKTLQGIVPSEIGHLAQLQILQLADNQLTGFLPTDIGRLDHATILDLSSNSLAGPIPSDIMKLAVLETLLLQDNKLTGTLPSEIGNLQQLSRLDVSSNNLVGVIPTEIGSQSNLQHLTLSINNLTGTLPSEIGLLTELTNLAAHNNKLFGPIPTEIGSQKLLIHQLDLAENFLTGTIPTEIGLTVGITVLDLAHNTLSGFIPSEIGGLNQLDRLYLFDNHLTGTIPTEIAYLGFLFQFDVSSNFLQGSIPTEIRKLSYLQTLALDGNHFTGLLPSEIEMLSGLTSLSASSNLFHGPIASEIGILSNLTMLYLPSNRLSGTLPFSIGMLQKLSTLDISANQLQGTVPTELAALPLLEHLNLSLNNVTGNLTQFFCNRTTPPPEIVADCLTKQLVCPCCAICCNVTVCKNVTTL